MIGGFVDAAVGVGDTFNTSIQRPVYGSCTKCVPFVIPKRAYNCDLTEVIGYNSDPARIVNSASGIPFHS